MLSATRKSSFAKSTLAALVRDRAVRCDDEGPDPVYPTRRIGACWVEGDDLNLNQRLVREGWALNFEPYAKHRFKADRTTRKTTDLGSGTAASQYHKTCGAGTRARPDYWVHPAQTTLAIFFSRIAPPCHPAARLRGRLRFTQRSRATAALPHRGLSQLSEYNEAEPLVLHRGRG
jgi:hypothetical protein